jgi:DNA modification methylase
MARKQKKAAPTKRLFRDPSGQEHMFEKSLEEELEAKKNAPVECLGMTFPNDGKRLEYFLEKLREKLKDSEFRKIEGFPIGTDEDILALSDPPYYTACPNPFIADFINYYGKPYDAKNDKYRCEPFAFDVSEGKHDPIYKAHTYHTKVPPKAIEKFIRHYTKPGDLVLDPYAGSGMSGVAGRLVGGRTVIQGDLAPAASHIAGGALTTRS